jgi:predicted aspartyl protease
MEVYRLSNRVVRRAQALCPPRGGFAVANLFRANGAISPLACGNPPRGSNTAITSAEGALQSEGGDPPRVASESRFQRSCLPNSVNPCALPKAPIETAPLAQRISAAMRERIAFQLRKHSRVRTSCKTRARGVRIFMFVLLLLAPLSISGAAQNRSAMQLPGYKAVPVYYRPLNKMIMSVRINGQLANLLVDTGSNQLIIDANAAERFGVKPSQGGLRYIRFTKIQGEEFPVGYAQSITAGSMNFGSSPVTVRKSPYSDPANANVDGILGLDLLLGHKAVINFRTKLLFFKVDQTRQTNLGAIAASEKFTSVPIRREENGALTVPCSAHGQPARLLLDTGAFVTALNESFVKSLGIASAPMPVSAHFPNGLAKKISAAKINDLKIGNFRVPPGKFGTTALPGFALQQGSSKIAGILGVDKLYICHAIIDLDGMRLFLK